MPASRDINFTAETKEILNIKDLIFQWVVKNGKRIVIITQAIVLLVFLSRFKFDNDIRNLKTEIEKNQSVVESYSDLEKSYVDNQKKIDLVRPVLEKQSNWEKRLADFNKKVPNDLQLENLNFTDKSVNLTAKAQNAQSFQIFVGLLVQDRTIKSAVLKSSQYDSKEQKYKFLISMDL